MESVIARKRSVPGRDALREAAAHLDMQIEEQEKILRSVSEILAQLKRARSAIKISEQDQEYVELCSDVSDSRSKPVPAKRRRKRANSDAFVVRDFAKSALKEAGRPLKRSELLDRLTKAGIVLNSDKPLKRIGKIMWDAKDEFTNHGEGYWFAGESFPKDS